MEAATNEEVRKAFSKVYAKLKPEEKANYGDIVEEFGSSQREVSHGERDLQAESKDVKERELHSRCSFDRLHRIFNFLTPAQKEAVRQAGFETFLRRDVPYVSTSLVKCLVENINPSRCTLTLNGKKYTMSASNFEYVMEIKDSSENLEKQLEDSQDADELFVARFTLVAIGTVLCPLSEIYLSKSIRRYQVNKAKNLSGCTLYLQLFYLDHVQWENGLIDRTIALIDFRDSQKCSRVMKWIRNVGGFTSPEVPLLKPGKEKDQLCPTRDVKLKKLVPMKYLKKDAPSPSGYLGHNIGHSTEKKDNDELMVLKNEVATLRSIVVGFPDHVVKIIEKEAEKTRNTLIVEVKKMVESMISQRFVRTKEDENVLSMDEGDNFIETSIENIRMSCGATSKAKSAATSKGKRIAEEFDEETTIGEELSPFEKDRYSSEGSPIKEGTPVTKGSSSLEATLKDLTALCKKKMVPVVLKCEVVERKAEKSSGNKKRVLMDESTWYADFTKSNGFTVGPFKVRDEAARVEVFKVAFFVLSSTLDSGYEVALYGKVSVNKKSAGYLCPGGEILGCIIDCYCQILSHEERERCKPAKPKVWYMPMQVSPQTVDLWDSIAAAMHKTARVEATLEMLQILDNLFLFDIKMGMPDGFKFAEFKINLKPDVQQQSNGTDCGLFVMKLKQLALVVCHDLNKVKSTCLRDCEEHFQKFAENEWQSKGDDHEANLEGPVHSPKKSPVDPCFATKKLKARNKFTGSSPAHRTRNAKRRQLRLGSS
ncbi:Ulp1 protease family, C-terminal catalytic domain containing protein [Trema orientale]|uniref:Ulp1 protease family, C-terminal catalytic domain containing protein n=1 Tax=Trema orientale TaxID=63057 RepID=A0A2P5B627_TREOI|nr:Ulp1 protease family, C-terminal catalytic domain containing protein [Trema orientale]